MRCIGPRRRPLVYWRWKAPPIGFFIKSRSRPPSVRIGACIRRRYPVVTLLLSFPVLGLSAFQTQVGARVSGPAKTDLIPTPWVGVVNVYAIFNYQFPEAAHR